MDQRPYFAASMYLDRCHITAKYNMEIAQRRQEAYANRSRQPAVFKEGNQVLLSTTKIKMKGKTFKKLRPRWLGPFIVTRVVPHNAVELNSQKLGFNFHPVVNVERLKHYHSRMNIDKLNEELERDLDGDNTDAQHESTTLAKEESPITSLISDQEDEEFDIMIQLDDE